MRNKVTMRQIAHEAGVSITTVSRVLSGHPLVSKETRARVEGLIKKYSFKPDSVARSLVRRQSNMLGMMVQDIGNPYFATMYLQAERYAARHGYTLLMASSLSFDNEIDSIRALSERRVDGMLLLSSSLDASPVVPELVSFLRELQKDMSLVLLSEPVPGFEGVYVVPDNARGYLLATRYLLSLGHRRIALIGGDHNSNTMRIRFEAFKSALRERGLEIHPDCMQPLGHSAEDGERAMSRLLGSGFEPTAVVTMNDLVTLGALKVLNRQGLSVPRDISIISCDNTYISRALAPELTSIDISPGMQGERAVALLIGMIEGHTPEPMTRIEPELVIRGSTARPREE